jgi:hypothetical protein
MHTLQPIPNSVILLRGHPTRSHEEVEDEVHAQEQQHNIEDLSGNNTTMVIESTSLRLTM